MFHSILVPLDGSSFGEQALPLALSIARRSGAAIELMHVHQFVDSFCAELTPMSGPLEEGLRKAEKEYLENAAHRMLATGPARINTFFCEGDVATQVRSHAVKINSDLVIMTTHARGALGRIWLGSRADELIRELPMPVLLVHPKENAAGFRDDIKLETILVPLDGSTLAEQMLEPATALARLATSTIVLMRVIRPLLPSSPPIGMGTFSNVAVHLAQDIDRLQRQLEQEAFVYLERIAQKLSNADVPVKTQVVVADQPGVGILKEAREIGCDLIALETHGRRGLKRMFLGSVADKVLRGSTVPVLLHRPKH